MIRLIVILCYIILGASLGVYLIPEIITDAGLGHFTLLTNNYVNGVVGVVLCFVICGWFIKIVALALKELQQVSMRQSAIDVLFATIGRIIGLLISVTISFIF